MNKEPKRYFKLVKSTDSGLYSAVTFDHRREFPDSVIQYTPDVEVFPKFGKLYVSDSVTALLNYYKTLVKDSLRPDETFQIWLCEVTNPVTFRFAATNSGDLREFWDLALKEGEAEDMVEFQNWREDDRIMECVLHTYVTDSVTLIRRVITLSGD